MHALLLHPADNLPHSDALGLPPWAQWLGVALFVGTGAWMVADAWAERRAVAAEPPVGADPADRRAGERLVRGATGAGMDGVPVPDADDHDLRGTPGPQTAAANDAAWLTPPGLLLFGLAVAAGWLALDRARAVEAVAAFIGNEGTGRAATIAFAFAALFWVGGALALVAPRGAALAFALAGGCGVVLATVSRWEERLEWWGAGAASEQWDGLAWWTAAAFGFALLALVAGRYGSRR